MQQNQGLLYISTMLITFLHKVMCVISDLVLTEDWLQNYLNAMKGVIGKIICNLVPRVSLPATPLNQGSLSLARARSGEKDRPCEQGCLP